MPLPAPELERLILAAFPDAKVTLADLAGDDDHFSVTVISEAFRGKSRVEQHRMVMAALGGDMAGGRLHALAVKTGVA